MSKHRAKVIFYALLALTALSSSGCMDGLAQKRAEKEIVKMLPMVLGPADSYKVDVDGSTGELRRGYIRRVDITGLNVKPDGLPRMTRLEGHMKDVQVDMKAKTITASGPATWSGWIDNTQLAVLMRDKVSYIQNLKVQVHKGVVVASGKMSVRGIGASGSVQGIPSVHSEKELWITPTKMESFGLDMNVPVWGQKKVDPFINPIFTVPDSTLNIRIESVAAEEGLLKVSGSFDPKGLTQAANVAEKDRRQ